jgi:dTDP-4-dehydrorhamnose reductase
VPRIVVTGGGGMLGSTLIPHLLSIGSDIVTFGRNKKSDFVLDLSEPQPVFDALTNCAPDVVINLAALADVDACEAKPELAYLANSLTVENLAAWVRNSSGKAHLIQISTDQVYSGDGPHVEGRACPVNYYAYSKLLGEAAAARAGGTVMRTNFFGPSRCAGRRSLSDWIVDVLRRDASANVFSDILFSPVTMSTLSKFIGIAVARRIGGTFNVGSTDGFSKADFAFELARNLSLSPERLTRCSAPSSGLLARRPTDMRMNTSLFQRCFNIVVPTLSSEIQSMREEYAESATS